MNAAQLKEFMLLADANALRSLGYPEDPLETYRERFFYDLLLSLSAVVGRPLQDHELHLTVRSFALPRRIQVVAVYDNVLVDVFAGQGLRQQREAGCKIALKGAER